MRTNELILYKDMEDGELLQDMTFLMENYNNEYYNEDDMKSLLYSTIGDLTELSVSHGFEGNLWHTYLTYLMVSHENAHSTSCEIVGPVEGSINIAALHDFKIFKELFDYDFQNLGEVLGEDGLAMIRVTRGSMDMDRSSMRESVTVSVTLQRHLMERNVQKNLKRK